MIITSLHYVYGRDQRIESTPRNCVVRHHTYKLQFNAFPKFFEVTVLDAKCKANAWEVNSSI